MEHLPYLITKSNWHLTSKKNCDCLVTCYAIIYRIYNFIFIGSYSGKWGICPTLNRKIGFMCLQQSPTVFTKPQTPLILPYALLLQGVFTQSKISLPIPASCQWNGTSPPFFQRNTAVVQYTLCVYLCVVACFPCCFSRGYLIPPILDFFPRP